jgi:DnaJ-class molecular chaperone
MSLKEALCGKVVPVPTFDGRELAVPATQIVAPGDSLTVPGEGICGADLIICFEVTFPSTLTVEQKKTLKATLP